MKESEVKRAMVKDIQAEGGYARRIEDRYTVGMPDLVLIPNLCPVIWAEAKIFPYNIFRPTPRQLEELTRLYRPPHCITFMIGWKNGVHYIAPPDETIHIDNCLKQEANETIGDLIRRAVLEEYDNGRNTDIIEGRANPPVGATSR